MESVAALLVLGALMIVLGLVPGQWNNLVWGVATGITNFSDALRGNPSYDHGNPPADRNREPIVALLGVALILLGILASLMA